MIDRLFIKTSFIKAIFKLPKHVPVKCRSQNKNNKVSKNIYENHEIIFGDKIKCSTDRIEMKIDFFVHFLLTRYKKIKFDAVKKNRHLKFRKKSKILLLRKYYFFLNFLN